MYTVEDLGTLIESAGLGTIGKDLFLYHSPAEVENCIIVFPSNEPAAIDAELPFYRKARFQLIVRNVRYQDGLDVSKALSDALTFTEKETTQMKIKRCRPLYEVRIYRRSEAGVIEFSVTYELIYVLK